MNTKPLFLKLSLTAVLAVTAQMIPMTAQADILKIGPEGRVVHIPFDEIVDYVRPACFSCADFTNIYSDISFGGLGSPDKYTTVIPRTEKGKKIFHKVLDEKIIKKLGLKAPDKENMKELITKFSHSKMKREAGFVKNL